MNLDEICPLGEYIVVSQDPPIPDPCSDIGTADPCCIPPTGDVTSVCVIAYSSPMGLPWTGRFLTWANDDVSFEKDDGTVVAFDVAYVHDPNLPDPTVYDTVTMSWEGSCGWYTNESSVLRVWVGDTTDDSQLLFATGAGKSTTVADLSIAAELLDASCPWRPEGHSANCYRNIPVAVTPVSSAPFTLWPGDAYDTGTHTLRVLRATRLGGMHPFDVREGAADFWTVTGNAPPPPQ